MTSSEVDRPSLTLELGIRVVFAFLVLNYFLGLPQGPAAGWSLDMPVAVAGVLAYLAVQGALFARAAFGRSAAWPAPLAALTDAVAVLGALASDPLPLPPTLALVLIAALNAGLRGGWQNALAALVAAGAVTAGGLSLREQELGLSLNHETTSLLTLLFACLSGLVLLAIRQQMLRTHAARHADQDVATQLLNRRGFDNAARYLLPLQQRTQLPLVLLLASLDRRDAGPLDAGTLGQAARQVGHVVRQRSRRSDVAARLTDDEFLFMLFDTSPAGAETLARALLDHFDDWAARQGIDARLTFGLVITPEEPVAIDQLIARARSAVHRAQQHPSSPSVVTAPSL